MNVLNKENETSNWKKHGLTHKGKYGFNTNILSWSFSWSHKQNYKDVW